MNRPCLLPSIEDQARQRHSQHFDCAFGDHHAALIAEETLERQFLGQSHAAVDDTSIELLPVDGDDIDRMIGRLKVDRLLRGYRGKPACDVEALHRAIEGLAGFFLAHRHLIDDIEINPLIVLGKGNGVRAVDIRGLPVTQQP